MGGVLRHGVLILLLGVTILADNVHSAFVMVQVATQSGSGGRLSDFFVQVMNTGSYRFLCDILSWLALVVIAIGFGLQRWAPVLLFLALKFAVQLAPFAFAFRDVPAAAAASGASP